MKTSKYISIVENVEERKRIVVLLQRGTKMYFGVLIQREFNREKYICIYVGLNREQYEIIFKDKTFFENLPGYFIGIGNETIDVKQMTVDRLMMSKPTHYVGFIKPAESEVQATLMAFADSVYDRLERVNESAA